jgi:hypothetical protein
MDYRRYSRWAEWGVAAVVAILHLLICLWPGPPTVENVSLFELLKDPQWIAAIPLLLAWALLGPGRPLLRGVAVPILAGLFFWATSQAPALGDVGSLFVLTLFGSSLCLLLGLVALGLRVRNAGENRSRQPAQFSLRGLVLATTAIAAVIGLLEALRPTLNEIIPLDRGAARVAMEVRQLVLGTVVAMVAVGSLWVMLQSGAMWLHALIVAVSVLSASLYLTHLTGGATSDLTASAWRLGMAISAIGLICGVSALPLRLMGYRLQRVVPRSNKLAGQF